MCFKSIISFLTVVIILMVPVQAASQSLLTDSGFVEASSMDSYRGEVKKFMEADPVNYKKSTAIHAAVKWGGIGKINFLIKSGFDVDAVDESGFTALHLAVSDWGGIDKVKLLVEAGANFNAMTDDGDTPLMIASRDDKIVVVNYLVSAGADPTIVNEIGLDAAGWAKNESIRKFLAEKSKFTMALKSGDRFATTLSAAEGGDSHAQLVLSSMYYYGIHAQIDFVKAAYWMEKSASADNVDAKFYYAQMLEFGLGVERNPLYALQWNESAARRGHSGAIDKDKFWKENIRKKFSLVAPERFDLPRPDSIKSSQTRSPKFDVTELLSLHVIRNVYCRSMPPHYPGATYADCRDGVYTLGITGVGNIKVYIADVYGVELCRDNGKCSVEYILACDSIGRKISDECPVRLRKSAIVEFSDGRPVSVITNL